MSAEKQKIVTREWTWFTDYVYLYADWTINVEAGHEVEVGVGVKFRGKPRGGRFEVSGHHEFTTYGMGAIHVRTTNPAEACSVRVDLGNVGAINIYSDPSQLTAALDSIRAVHDELSK